jgi:hypothetical protein
MIVRTKPSYANDTEHREFSSEKEFDEWYEENKLPPSIFVGPSSKPLSRRITQCFMPT